MAENTNKMKAMYPIVLPKSSNVADNVRSAENINEQHLNDNFNTLLKASLEILESIDTILNSIGFKITRTKDGYVIGGSISTQTVDSLGHILKTVLSGGETVFTIDGKEVIHIGRKEYDGGLNSPHGEILIKDMDGNVVTRMTHQGFDSEHTDGYRGELRGALLDLYKNNTLLASVGHDSSGNGRLLLKDTNGNVTFDVQQGYSYSSEDKARMFLNGVYFDNFLAPGEIIAENEDLDYFDYPCVMSCESASDAATLSNCPVSTAFKLIVVSLINGGTRLVQILIGNSSTAPIRVRHYNGSSWGSWRSI